MVYTNNDGIHDPNTSYREFILDETIWRLALFGCTNCGWITDDLLIMYLRPMLYLMELVDYTFQYTAHFGLEMAQILGSPICVRAAIMECSDGSRTIVGTCVSGLVAYCIGDSMESCIA
jgi:hypothetical protein